MEALATIFLGDDKRVAPGETFDIEAKEGEVLEARGFAREHAPERKPAPAAKTSKAAKATAEPAAPAASEDGPAKAEGNVG